MFGPQPRSYDFRLPRKVSAARRRGARAASAGRIAGGRRRAHAAESKTKAAAELLKRLGADGKALLIDVQPEREARHGRAQSSRRAVLASARVDARDVMNASRVIATKAAVEKLQELGSLSQEQWSKI